MSGPKAKSRKIVSKRFKFTKGGKIERKHSRTSHRKRIDDASTRGRKRRLAQVGGKFVRKIKAMVVRN